MDAYCSTCQEQREMVNPQEIVLSNDEPATRGDCHACGTRIYRTGKPTEPVPLAPRREPACFCGIEIAKATRMCMERDCPYRR